MQSYNILLVDDEKDVCEVFIENAREISIDENFDLQITDCQNWEDGSELLQKQYFHAIILDARCMIDREQKTENFGFLSFALERLKEIEKKQDRHIPFAVNTGQFGDREREMISNLITERKGKIFDKKKPKENLIKFLVSEIENESNTQIEKKYFDVFKIFEKNHLDITFRNHLSKLLKVCNSDNQTDIKQSLALLRSLQEQMFQTLNKKDRQIVPDSATKPKVSFWKVNDHLSGNPKNVSLDRSKKDFQPTTKVFQNDSIKNLSECIYKITSDNGSHNPYESTPLPNKYTVQSLTLAFLEQLLWFNALMK